MTHHGTTHKRSVYQSYVITVLQHIVAPRDYLTNVMSKKDVPRMKQRRKNYEVLHTFKYGTCLQAHYNVLYKHLQTTLPLTLIN